MVFDKFEDDPVPCWRKREINFGLTSESDVFQRSKRTRPTTCQQRRRTLYTREEVIVLSSTLLQRDDGIRTMDYKGRDTYTFTQSGNARPPPPPPPIHYGHCSHMDTFQAWCRIDGRGQLTQWWPDVGPTSLTLAQHRVIIEPPSFHCVWRS